MSPRLTVLLAAALVSGCASMSQPPSAASARAITSADHWVEVPSAADGKPVKIYVREKYSTAIDPSAAARQGKVVVLAHGAGTPGSIAFDLQVPGAASTYSMMDDLASRGFDVFTLDYQNYGRSDKHACGLCVTTQAAAKDVGAVVELVRRIRGVDKVHLLGWSWGTNISGLYAMQNPGKVNRLVLYAPPVWTEPRGQAPTAQFRATTLQNSRDLFEAPASDPAAVEAWASEVNQWAPNPPNGVLLDLNTKMPLTDPAKIMAPTMIIIGALDRATPINQPNLPVFFAALPNKDKQLIIIPNAGHALVAQKARARLYGEAAKWFSVE